MNIREINEELSKLLLKEDYTTVVNPKLAKVEEKMIDLSNDADAMRIEHEFAEDILNIINPEKHFIGEPKPDTKTDEEKLEAIKNYCTEQLNDANGEEIIADYAEDILETIN